MTEVITGREQEESLREAAAHGNEEGVETLVRNGVQVNAQNSINGWTPLHWACKRGHRGVVERLIQHGADVNLLTAKGETCLQMTDNPAIIALLGGIPDDVAGKQSSSLPIVPNYISNPVFPYFEGNDKRNELHKPIAPYSSPATSISSTATACCDATVSDLVLKVRVANSDDPDFIEIDVPNSVSFEQLVSQMRNELGVAPSAVVRKVRKLPDTILRNDRDVRRLRNYQELELVLASGHGGAVGPSVVSPPQMFKVSGSVRGTKKRMAPVVEFPPAKICYCSGPPSKRFAKAQVRHRSEKTPCCGDTRTEDTKPCNSELQ